MSLGRREWGAARRGMDATGIGITGRGINPLVRGPQAGVPGRGRA